MFYRYGWISAWDHDLSNTINSVPVTLNSTNSMGHSSEAGMRLRGVWTCLLCCDALVRTGAANSGELDRGQRASVGGGLGYVVSRRVVVTFDVAGGTSRVASSRFEDATGNVLQNGTANGHFVSDHAAIQIDLSRQLFVSASYLNVWRAQNLNVNLFLDQFGTTSLVQDSFFPLSRPRTILPRTFPDFARGLEIFAEFLRSISLHDGLRRNLIEPFVVASVHFQAARSRVGLAFSPRYILLAVGALPLPGLAPYLTCRWWI